MKSRKRVFTHCSGDMDSYHSAAAVTEFVDGFQNAQIVFVSGSYNGKTMRPSDMAVDINAGGKGIKGTLDLSGTRHSSFKYIIDNFAPKADQDALAMVVTYIDTVDAYGPQTSDILGIPRHLNKLFQTISINGLMRGFQALYKDSDRKVYKMVKENFRAMLAYGRMMSVKKRGKKSAHEDTRNIKIFKKILLEVTTEQERGMIPRKVNSYFWTAENFENEICQRFRMPLEFHGMFQAVSILGLIAGYRILYRGNSKKVYRRIRENIKAMIAYCKQGVLMREYANSDNVKWFENNKVAVTQKSPQGVSKILMYGKNAMFVVFEDGFNIGVLSNKKLDVHVDAPELIAAIEDSGEQIAPPGKDQKDKWFIHTDRYILCWGSRKAPAKRAQRLTIEKLTEAAINAVRRIEKERSEIDHDEDWLNALIIDICTSPNS